MKKLIPFLFFLLTMFSVFGQADGNVITATNIAQARTLSPFDRHKTIHVRGHTTPGDGGHGTFVWTNTITGTNTGIRIASSTAGWSLQRVYDGPVDPRWFGAKLDGATDDVAPLTNSINALLSQGGGTLLIPKGVLRYSAGIAPLTNIWIQGEDMKASVLEYTGTNGYAITFGSTSSSALSYGSALSDISVRLTSTNGSAIQVAGTAGAAFSNVYIEGVPSNNSVGIYVNGANSSAIFTSFLNVDVNHFKYGLRVGTSGTLTPTSLTCIGLNVFGDNVAGSIGIEFLASGGVGSGDGCRVIGGNVEGYATGIKTDSARTSFYGVRFESNTADIELAANARGNSFFGCVNVATITDTASHKSNGFIGNINASSEQTFNRLDSIFNYGNLTIQKLAGGTRYVVLNDTTDGEFTLQAGPGSSALGGSITMRGSTHATDKGGVLVGLGGSGSRKFRVNTDINGSGTDLFSIDQSGNLVSLGTITGTTATLGAITSTTGNLTLSRSQGATRYILLSDTTTGNMLIQAGIGSSATGGSVILNGSNAGSNKGGVTLGLGGTGTRYFKINSDGLGTGADVFQMNELGETLIGSGTIDDSAKLQVDSTTKGFLPPRMTKAQRNAIVSPENGLIIYQTDNTPGIRFYESGAWVRPTVSADP